MTRILQGAPFQLGAVALTVVLLAAGMLLRVRDTRPAPQYSDDLHDPDELPGMPPRPAGCQPAASAPRWHGAWDSKGAVDASYDPCGAPLSRTPETRRKT